MPHIQNLSKEFAEKGLQVLSISFVSNKDIVQKTITAGLRGEEASFTVLPDGWDVYKAFKGRGVPNTFLIDKAGDIRYFHHSFKWRMVPTFRMEIEALLAEKV